MEPEDQIEDLIFGLHPVIEAFNAGKQIDRILLQDGISQEVAGRLRSLAKVNNVPIQNVPTARLDTLSKGKRHQGIAAFLAPIVFQNLEKVLAAIVERGETALLVLADKVTDVRNLGAIARTTECLGGHALIIPETGTGRINADAVKASAGALHFLPVCRERNLKDAIHFLKESGVRIIACHEEAVNPLSREDLSGPVCLVFGSESEGISPLLINAADAEVHIPMKGKITSLNVSVATGIALYEVVSQRGG